MQPRSDRIRKFGRHAAAAAVVASLALAAVLVGGRAKPTVVAAQEAKALPADLKLVHPDALGFVHVRLADLWKQESMKQLRMIVEKAGPKALAALDEQFVPKPSTAERVTAIILPPSESEEPSVVAMLHFSAAFDPAAVGKAFLPAGKKQQAGSKAILAEDSGEGALHFPDDRTLMFSDKKTLAAYLTMAPKEEGGLTEAIKLAASGKPFVAAANISRLPVPPELTENLPAEFKPLLKAQTLVVTMDVAEAVTLNARLTFPTEADAKAGDTALRRAAQMAQIALNEPRAKVEFELFEKNKDKRPRPLEDLPLAVGSVAALGGLNYLDEILADLPVKHEGNAVTGSVTLPPWATQYLGMSAMSAGLLLPAVQKVREAASRAKSSNNLKQIALAVHNYHDVNNAMPPAAIVDKKGKKLLSWRVMILPYIEQDALYKQFKLDEPWDSEHNKKLLAIVPAVYIDPRMPAEPGKTYYKGFVGKNAGFDVVRGRKFSEFTDGLSNTLMIAVGGDPVEWTKPDDIEFDPDKDLPDLSKPFGNLMVAMFDGSVRVVSPNTPKDQKLMKRLIQINDGEVIPDF